jgi:hypothetical protein
LLCKPHHERVDKRHPEDYPPETLISWKEAREAGGIAALNALGTIDENELADELKGAAIEITNSTVTLGGTGGSAPAAGGGGGGVIGDGTGGPGGPGGHVNLAGVPGTAPGAGGGGSGAIGPDAIGAEGGGGGQFVSGVIKVQEGDQLRVHVGEGGHEGRAGEDTYVELVGKDGVPREVFRAKGGVAGRSGVGLRDERDGPSLRITSAFFCDAAQIKQGLLNVWGAGWNRCDFDSGPASFSCVVAVIAEAVVPGPRETELTFTLVDSEGNVRAEDVLPVSYEANPIPHRIPLAHRFDGHDVTESGIWRVLITSGRWVLSDADIRLEVKPGPRQGSVADETT